MLTRRLDMHRGTPTDQLRSRETVTAANTQPKKPGTSFFCESSDFKDLANSKGICGAAGGKYNLFSGVSLGQIQIHLILGRPVTDLTSHGYSVA